VQVQKKYWWIIGIAVPIIVAAIGIIPQLIPKDGGRDTIYVDVVGTQFNGKVAFNNVAIAEEQSRQLGIDIPEEVVEKLHKALELAQAKNFNEAIPALESVAKIAPVPAVFNNLGAAYLAIGNKEKARGSLKKARAGAPDQETARFNLEQMENTDTSTTPDPEEIPMITDKEAEPNNEILNPNTVPLGTWIKGSVSDGQDIDYFKFGTPPIYRDVISIEVKNCSTSLKPWVRFFNQKKSEVGQSYDDTPGAVVTHSFQAQPNSAYYFFVRGYNNSYGAYTVTVTQE